MTESTAPVLHETESPKRHDILAAAGMLFMQLGYGATSVDAIARAALVSKATLYAHFPSKEALFATIIDDACRTSLAAPILLPEDDPDVARVLRTLGDQMLRFILEGRALAIHRVVIAEAARFPELGRAFWENGPGRLRQALSAWMQRQQDAGRLRRVDAGLAADQFLGLLRSGGHVRATLGLPPPTEAEIDRTVQAAVDTFLRAFAPTG
ncbi:MAG: TetR/AcrR family transcriptional regulator [Rhodospirillales bacterium]|nr:TetR/AcrR family transcriptional regulator [Rhodospirillales bacterium]MBN8907417.1 TetR/AcrR family transcriptional regulator [Rhodospirillales bacterium]